MSLTQLREEVLAWREANPLRRWRVKNKWTQGMIADVVGVSAQSIRSYESGHYRPDRGPMSLIAALLQRDVSKMNKEWTRWLNKRPEMAA